MSLESKPISTFRTRFYRASTDQPLWTVSVLAIRLVPSWPPVRYQHAALPVWADDEDQAKGIGQAFLEGRFPKSAGWTHSISVSSITFFEVE